MELNLYMKITHCILACLICLPLNVLANPIKGMLERIDEGASPICFWYPE